MMRTPSAGELLVGVPSSAARVDPKPAPFLERARTLLDPLVEGLVRVGISADTVTAANLVFGLIAACLAAYGAFGPAAVALGIGSIGDALDGAIARATKTASLKGAIFDASV
ncbi:MAG: CDP-alcohol phosphatidyltransferase family protein, partial [Polyangiaceae bacterium]